MAGKTDFFENAVLKLIFQGLAIANIADNAETSPITNLYLSLHTADPTDAESGQTTYEVSYTDYARVAIVRTSSGWAVSGNTVTPLANTDFPQAGAGMVGSVAATHAGIGTAASGTGVLLYSGAISPSVTIAAGVTPRLTTSSTITED